MMIRNSQGEVTCLAGSMAFRSAFRKSKRKSGPAYRRMRDALQAKGYYLGGRKPIQMPDPESLSDGWGSPGVTDLLNAMKSWTQQPRNVDYWENPDTGQRIWLKDFMVATDIWTLPEVMELVP